MITTLDELSDMMAVLMTAKVCAIDCETISIEDKTLRGVGIWSDKGHWFIRAKKLRKYLPKAFKLILARKALLKIFHNAKFDLAVFRNIGVYKVKNYADTMIMAHLLNEKEEYGLKYLGKRILGLDMEELDMEKAKSMKWLEEYCLKDAKATYMLYKEFLPIIKEQKLEACLDMETKLVKSLMDMEQHGALIDVKYLKGLRRDLKEKSQILEKKIYREAGEEFNIASPKQVGQILYEKMKIPAMKTRKGNYATSVGILKRLAVKHKIADDILEYRKQKKLLSTYIKGMLKEIHDDNTVHTQFNQTNVRTGRLSSSHPNLQNIPVGKTWDCRKMFIVSKGCKLIVCFVEGTKILGADLKWHKVEDLKVNQEVIGFDEKFCQYKHNFKASKVKKISALVKPCYKIETDLGVITVSEEHMLVKSGKNDIRERRQWIKAKNIREGDNLSFYTAPWKVESTQEAGYLAGIFDGEGYVSTNRAKLGFSQKEGILLKIVRKLLEDRGFDYGEYQSNSSAKSLVLRGRGAILRFLGSIRPLRLLEKGRGIWENKRTWSQNSAPAIVKSVKYVGKKKVYAVNTTTHTLIAEGFLSHNCDYEQIELRVMAVKSKDPVLCKMLRDGVDVHQKTADAFGIDRNKKAKGVNFGLIYGLHWKSLAKQLDIPFEQAKDFYDRWYKRFKQVKRYQEAIKEFCRAKGYVRTISGRKRRLEEIWSDDFYEKGGAERKSVNTVIQGGACDIIKAAMVKLRPKLKKGECDLFVQVHDELLFECKEELTDKYVKIIRQVMEHPLKEDLIVPLPVNISIVENWSQAKG